MSNEVIEFYDVGKREKVSVPFSELRKTTYERETSKGTQTRYAVKATTSDGRSLTKFVTKEFWDSLDVEVI